jgi:two-component system CheB/CheR fusion protein
MPRRPGSKTTKAAPEAAQAPVPVAVATGDKCSGHHHHYVVGIGASAGGLEALTALVSNLRKGAGMSYVVVQHLSPSYKSMLPQLLARETELPVIEAVDGQAPVPDTIYITPPNRNVVLRDGILQLIQSPREISPKPSVNLFLSSLAEERKEDAIGIILSGTGSDGSSGIRAIKASGGFSFAQDPKTARYDGMPQSAIDTGCVDWIQSPEEIAAELARLAEARPVLPTTDIQELPLTALKRLLAKVRTRTKLDFSGYKESTLWRRVERRLFANRKSSLDSYLEFVDEHPDELERLARDILISVTSFFRDREPFQALEEVQRRLLRRKEPGDEVRVWVPGCATGEEAYSIAIQLHKLLGGSFDQYRVQIFATDVDMEAMQVARRGVYSASLLSELGPDVVQRYFRPIADRYEISKTIRDMVIFARQDLVLDPPFLRLDLISCRNVLIYLQPQLQARILSLFHYALLPDGHLFLGKSESVAQQDLLFVPEAKESRIFRRRAEGVRSLPSSAGNSATAFPAVDSVPSPAAPRPASREQAIVKAASQFYVPPSVVVNADMQIQHVLGDASSYLQIPAGRPSLDLSSLLVRELKVEAQTLLRAAEQKKTSVEGRRRLPLRGKSGPIIRLNVHPLSVEGGERLYLVAFVPSEDPPEVAKSGDPHDLGQKELEDELVATREHMQTLVEELETSNEEMQALNEEVQAANEELQATNEELEAANEELQSTNEELLTINEELQVKSSDLIKTNSDLESIQNNVGMPIIVLDAEMRITRFNAAAEVQFKMHRGILGTEIGNLVLPKDMPAFGPLVQEAVGRRQPKEVHVSGDGHEYLLRITLIFGPDDRVAGAIVILLEQTEVLRATRLLNESESRLRAVMEHTRFLIAIKDVSGKYLYANAGFRSYFFAEGEKDCAGRSDTQLLSRPLAKRFRDEDLIALRRSELVEVEELVETQRGPRWLNQVRFPLNDSAGEVYALCIQITDVTEKRRADEQLRLAARVISGAAEAVMITDAQQRIVTVNEAFTKITGYAPAEVIGQTPRILRSERNDADFYRAMWEQLNRTGLWQGEMENRNKAGQLFTEWLTINAIRDEQGALCNYVAIFSDITSLREARRNLEFQAMHDLVTRLPNRALFNDRVRRAVVRAQRHQHRFALIFIDLDNFKDINDSLGHEYGDDVLRSVAERLTHAVREQDTVARLGGDEFVVLVDELGDSEIEPLVERCRQALDTPLSSSGFSQRVSASMGIAFYPADGEDVGALLQSADAAMYRAKESGPNTYCYSSAEIRRAPAERLSLINGLRQALSGGNELRLVYQPQYSLPDRRPIGLEALLRWNSPVLGEVPPSRFIPLAEESGLILPLTEWVFQAAMRQIKAWRAVKRLPPPVALNVSPLHIHGPGIGEALMRLLHYYDLSPKAVTVEVTESAMGHSPDAVAATLLQLKGMGIASSLDDFGTGYSSLSRLSRLPLTTLKIDRSFIHGLDDPDNVNDLEIARTVILMAHSLDMTAMAEGVETERQLTALTELGCNSVQGYLLSRPQEAEALTGLLPQGE